MFAQLYANAPAPTECAESIPIYGKPGTVHERTFLMVSEPDQLGSWAPYVHTESETLFARSREKYRS